MDDRYRHYFKPCPYDSVDVYRVLAMFEVTDPCLQHAVKKLLVAGGRGAGKDPTQDVGEAIVSLQRWQEMRKEEVNPLMDDKSRRLRDMMSLLQQPRPPAPEDWKLP